MTERAKCVLIPGVAALLISSLGERLLWQAHAVAPVVFQYWSWLTLSAPMLCLLLAAGGVGSVWSRHSGGSVRQRIWAAEFPAFCALLLLLVLFTWGVVLDLFLRHALTWQMIPGVLVRAFSLGVLVPALALLIGALPFLPYRTRSH
ncbi:MAG TPA: hypothetical protein VL523_02420 [Terriglobia bacterium]|nr:hypothetical protein [Terriglobia bacterium]